MRGPLNCSTIATAKNRRTEFWRNVDDFEQRCFKQNIDPSLKEVYRRSWALYYPIHVTHRISLPIVRMLAKTAVTPNQITFLSYVLGLLSGAVFLTADSGAAVLAGALLLEANYVLDAVDGQLARAKSAGSKAGAFLDEWGNFLVAPFVVWCIGLRFGPEDVYPWPAFLAAYAILSLPLIEMVIDRAFTDRKKITSRVLEAGAGPKGSPAKRIYSLLYRSCTMPVVMNFVTIASLLTLAGVEPALKVLVCYYAAAGTLVWIAKIVRVTLSK